MKYYPVKAFVMKGMKYGESHMILTLFSLEEGKFSAIAKGVRKVKSPLRGHLQLGNCCDFLLYRGRNLDTVNQAVVKESYPHIRENPAAYLYASYFLELIDASLPERAPQPRIFALLHSAFTLLAREEKALLARYFELQLLRESGYQPDFKHCAMCGKDLQGGFLSTFQEGILCGACGGGLSLSPQTLYGLHFLLHAGEKTIFRLKVDAPQMREMEDATGRLLQFHLEKKLKSREMLLAMERKT